MVSRRPPAECPAYRRRPLRDRMLARGLWGGGAATKLQVDLEAGFWKKYREADFQLLELWAVGAGRGGAPVP